MKKALKLILIILLVIVIAIAGIIAGVAIWQRENLKSIELGAKYSTEELEQKMEENRRTVNEKVGAMPEVQVRDLDDEELEGLKTGEMSIDELIERLTGAAPIPEPESAPASEDGAEAPPEEPAGTGPSAEPEAETGGEPENEAGQVAVPDTEQKPETEPEPEPAPEQEPPEESATEPVPEPENNANKRLAEIIARIYILRATYVNRLDEMEKSAKEEYHASDETRDSLMAIVSRYLTLASELENQCDDEMDAIVSELTALLRETGGDMSLVDTVIETYSSEKSLKKALYYSKLQERGII